MLYYTVRGGCCKYFLLSKSLRNNYNILAIIDSSEEKWGQTLYHVPIISISEIKSFPYECIIITPKNINGILETLHQNNIDNSKILFLRDVENELIYEVQERYKDTTDPEQRKFIDSFKIDEPFKIFGPYNPPETNDKVYYDGEDPYIIFDNKYRMYFPKDYSFITIDGEKYVQNLMWEQQPGSPHLYTDKPLSGNVLVDAGTCEGNFALRFVDNFNEIYLIEGDKKWSDALRKTFAPFGDKVHIIDKFLGRYDTENATCLDSIGIDNIDFLKMDIEGAEVDALLGGMDTLKRSKGNMSICSYHRRNDEKNIKFIMNSLGYQTKTSDGYMCFIYDQDANLELRRGIVYASK